MFERLFAELKGRNALITGANRGIGKSIALALGEAGSNIAVHYVEDGHNKQQACEVCQYIQRLGSQCVIVEGDVGIADDVSRIVYEAGIGLRGTVDILVNNAGIGGPKCFEDTTEVEYERQCAVNMKSAFLFVQALVPRMRAKKWGKIVNISSSAAFTGGRSGPHYAASKAGVLGLSRYYAAHLARDGITVNAVSPGPINTDMVKSYPAGDYLGETKDIVAAVLCLLSTGFLTGHTLHVNGGMYLS